MRKLADRDLTGLYESIELPLIPVLGAMEAVGIKRRHLPPRRDRRQAGRPGRGARGALPRAGRRAVRDRVAQAARRGAVRAARPARRPQGQDRLLDRRPGARQDPRPASDRRRRRAVAGAVEAPEHLPPAAPRPDRPGRRPPAHDVQPDDRRHGAAVVDPAQPPEHPDPHGARPRDPKRVRGRGGLHAALGRLLAGRASDPRPPLRGAGAARTRSPAARTSTG